MTRLQVCVNGRTNGMTIISRILALEVSLVNLPRKGEVCRVEFAQSDYKYLKVEQIYHDIGSNSTVVNLKEFDCGRDYFEEYTNYLMSKGWLVAS